MKITIAALSLSAVFALAAPAAADFVIPNGGNVPWVRGVSASSTYAQWESFASVAGPNVPGVGPTIVGVLPGGASAFNVSATGATAVVLGSGNIYSGNSPLSVTVTMPNFDLGAGGVTTILLQTRTQGTEINPATVLIGGVAPSQVTELSRVSLGPQGAMVETAWRWDLPGNAAAYTVTFSSGGPFFSLDAIAVDTFVPTPGAVSVGAVGLLAASRRRR